MSRFVVVPLAISLGMTVSLYRFVVSFRHRTCIAGGPPSATGGGRGDAGGRRGGHFAQPDSPVALRALVLMMRSLFEFSLVQFTGVGSRRVARWERHV